MSVKRYEDLSDCKMYADDDGEYVRYEDYKKLHDLFLEGLRINTTSIEEDKWNKKVTVFILNE